MRSARFFGFKRRAGFCSCSRHLVALAWANAPGLAPHYHELLALPVVVQLGPLRLDKNVLLLINDGLMAIFFLLVGLEIKREMLEGELSSLGQIALPGIAAVGGVALPAVIYTLLNLGDATALRGWAIPAATDIAFSLAVLSLLGPRVPTSLKVFVTALAVIDDLAAIMIIAIFYTDHLSGTALGLAVGSVALLALLNRMRVRSLGAYFVIGAFMWICVLKSGVHATLAGVALGLAIPLRATNAHGESLLRHLEHQLHPWVAYLILPLFALANAGVSFTGVSWGVIAGPISLGIALALVIGKTIGVFGAAVLVIKSGLATMPSGATFRAMFGVSIVTGIGFTMSLFIGMLAFEGQSAALGVATRVGVLGGSLISALCGVAVLSQTLPRRSAVRSERAVLTTVKEQ